MRKYTANSRWKKTLQTNRNSGYLLHYAQIPTQRLSANKVVNRMMCLIMVMRYCVHFVLLLGGTNGRRKHKAIRRAKTLLENYCKSC